MMRRSAILLLSALMLAAAAQGKKQRTSSDAMRQREQAQKQQTRTGNELKSTESELSAKLRLVGSLEAKIAAANARVDSLDRELTRLTEQKQTVADSISANEATMQQLRGMYVAAVRSARKHRRELSAVNFLFSAKNFKQASSRMRYLREFSAWRAGKAGQIQQINAELELQREQLAEMELTTEAVKAQATDQQRLLKASQDSLGTVVASLQGKTRQLNNMLRKQQRTIDELDREIDKLIAAEAAEAKRKAEEEARRKQQEEERRKKQAAAQQQKPETTAEQKQPAAEEFTPAPEVKAPAAGKDFASQKGRLPSPLSHSYVIAQGFGVQEHHSIKSLKINNSGVDLETSLEASARAVHAGEVTGVFMKPGLNYVVLIRHGQYITVYANLKSIQVKKSDKVTAGATIGTVAPSPVNPAHAQLHFEIRREREKFDPTLWLAR